MTSIPLRRLALSAGLLATACGGSDSTPGPAATPTTAAVFVRKTIAVGAYPGNVIADPLRGRAYVINLVDENVMVIDPVPGRVIATLTPLNGVSDIALDLDLRRLFIVSNRQFRVVGVDLDSLELASARVLGRRAPDHVAVDPVAHLVYTMHAVPSVLTILDGPELRELTSFVVEKAPSRAAVDTTNHRVFVTTIDGGAVDVIDGESLFDTVPVGPAPDGIVVDNAARTAYVSVTGANSVVAIDTTTDAVTARLAVGKAPGLAAIDPATRTLYVPNSGDNTLSVINLDTKATIAVLAVGRFPVAASVDTLNHNVYVANRNDNSVSVVAGVQ